MNSLDVEAFFRLSQPTRRMVLAWMDAHGINPDRTRSIEWGDHIVKARQYRYRKGRPFVLLTRPAQRTVRRVTREPFPIAWWPA